MTRIAVLLCIQTVVVAGCSLLARASDPPPGTAAPIESMTPPEATGKPLPPVDHEIAGVLGFDDIEGGCWYIETADATRYQVIYPEGWSLDSGSGRLLGPDGRAFAAGAVVTLRGSIDPDMSSACQIGPFLRASEVVNIQAPEGPP